MTYLPPRQLKLMNIFNSVTVRPVIYMDALYMLATLKSSPTFWELIAILGVDILRLTPEGYGRRVSVSKSYLVIYQLLI